MAPSVPPARATPFVGRARELTDLEGLLARGDRLITISGLGGIGKSRLASELAQRVASSATSISVEDVLAPDLDDAATPEALVDAVASVARAGPAGRGKGSAWLVRSLAARGPSLLVLDPFDRMIGFAPMLEEWLSGAPELAIVVVSRNRLRVPAEVVLEVGPLAVDGEATAVELFVSAVRAQRHGYAPEADERRILADIARELDGVPLALELAASRMGVMGASALLHRLRSRFEILRRPAPSGDRHGALEASIAWSWEVLEPWERDALAQCTVFRGGFGLDAAEAVVVLEPAGSPAILEVIESLRAKSLVRAHDTPGLAGEVRLSLYESVRAYATRGLTPAHVRELEARHARHYVEAAEGWASRIEQREGDEARARLLLERENLLAVVERILGRGTVSARIAELALRALVALSPVLSLRGPIEVYAGLIERALEVTAGSGADPRLQARGLLVRGTLRHHRGDVPGAERDLGEALVLAHHTGDAALEARSLIAITRIAVQRGDDARAALGIDKAEALAVAAADAGGEARAHLARAGLLAQAGDRQGARAQLERGLVRVRAMRSAIAEGPIRRRLAILELHEGRVEDARQHLAIARDIAEALQDRRGAGIARALGAIADHVDGRLPLARIGYGVAIAEWRAAGFATLEAMGQGLLGLLHAELGDRGEARLLIQAARASIEGSDPAMEVFFGCALSRIEIASGRPEAARAALAVARTRLAATSDASLAAIVSGIEAGLDGRAGDGDPVAAPSLALALLARLRDRGPASAPPRAIEESAAALRIGDGGSWFRAPGGERVDLSRRKPLRLILDRLAGQRSAEAGRPLAWDDLLSAGWPGEKMRPDAGAHRVRVAISTLRKLGLRDALRTDEDGYVLDPSVPLLRDA